MSNIARNRIIYNTKAVYVAPSSTGYHLQSGFYDESGSDGDFYGAPWTGITGRPAGGPAGTLFRSLLQPIHRVQTANFSFSVNRTDINEYGIQSRIDSLILEAPTVSLDFSYYITDGGNERKLGFNCPSAIVRNVSAATAQHNSGDLCNSGLSALSGHLEDNQGNNYFIAISREGIDAAGNTITNNTNDFNVVAIGNGYVSDYSVEAAVGSIPTASVSVEAFNIKVDDVASGSVAGPTDDPNIPAIDITGGTTGSYGSSKQYSIPVYQTGTVNSAGSISALSALRPGDIELTIGNASTYQGLTDLSEQGSAHIQSLSISIPMSRTTLPRLGSTFGYAKTIDTPININISISAILSELQTSSPDIGDSNFKANVYEMLCRNTFHDLTLTLKNCNGSIFGAGNSANMMQYIIKKARLESESFSSSLGDNDTVDITFTAQVGGANDTVNGIIMNGNYEPWTSLSYWPMGIQKDDDSAYGV